MSTDSPNQPPPTRPLPDIPDEPSTPPAPGDLPQPSYAAFDDTTSGFAERDARFRSSPSRMPTAEEESVADDVAQDVDL